MLYKYLILLLSLIIISNGIKANDSCKIKVINWFFSDSLKKYETSYLCLPVIMNEKKVRMIITKNQFKIYLQKIETNKIINDDFVKEVVYNILIKKKSFDINKELIKKLFSSSCVILDDENPFMKLLAEDKTAFLKKVLCYYDGDKAAYIDQLCSLDFSAFEALFQINYVCFFPPGDYYDKGIAVIRLCD